MHRVRADFLRLLLAIAAPLFALWLTYAAAPPDCVTKSCRYLPLVINQATIFAPTNTPTIVSAVTPSPTSQPGPPTLIAPADNAVLPQPVAPGAWNFAWEGRAGPCFGGINIDGPGGRHVESYGIAPSYNGPTYIYTYTTTEYLPNDALGPWHWHAGIGCPLGSSGSETRTFWVAPAPPATPTPTMMTITSVNHAQP